MRKRPGFWVYNDMFEHIDKLHLKADELGFLFYKMFEYSISGKYNSRFFDQNENLSIREAFRYFKENFDADAARLREKSERLKENGRKGGLAKAKRIKEQEDDESKV